MHFELNCGYHLRVSFQKNTNPFLRSKTANELSAELRKLMNFCRKNLHHAQKLQKQAHDKGVKPKSYIPNNKIWLNSQYIKTKSNRKLEAKFFGPFWVLHLIGKESYKLELPKKWKIRDVFRMSLLELDTTQERADKNVAKLEFDAGNSEEYKLEPFETARSMQWNQNRVIYQVSIT